MCVCGVCVCVCGVCVYVCVYVCVWCVCGVYVVWGCVCILYVCGMLLFAGTSRVPEQTLAVDDDGKDHDDHNNLDPDLGPIPDGNDDLEQTHTHTYTYRYMYSIVSTGEVINLFLSLSFKNAKRYVYMV